MERNNVLPGKDRTGLERTQASGAPGNSGARTQTVRLSWALSPGLGTALLYLAAMALTEALIALAAPLAGIVLYSLLMLAMIMHSSLGASGTRKRFLLALGLVPLIRVLTLSIPQFEFPPPVRYLLVGVPIFAGAVLAIRENQLSRSMLGLVSRSWPVQILVGSTGVALGYLEYLILRPAPLVAEFRWELIWLPALVLVLFSGLLEELIFRGIIQYTALSSLGRFSLLYVPAVFTILYLGQRPLLDILFLFAMAVFYGWVVLRTGSILGVTLSHALANAALFLVFPLLLTAPPNPGQAVHPNILGIGDLELQKKGLATATPALPTAAGILSETGEAVSTEIVATVTLVPSDTASSTATSSPTETASPGPTPSPTAQPTELPPTEPHAGGGPAPEAPACGPPAGWVTYVVRPGDSLYALSRTLGVSVAQLMEANCLNDPSRIYAGQRLYVPYLPPVPPPTPVRVLPTSTLRPTDPPPPTAEMPTSVPTPVPTEPPSEAPPTPAPTEPPATEAPPPPPPTEVPPPPEPIPTEVPPPTEVIITTEAPLP